MQDDARAAIKALWWDLSSRATPMTSDGFATEVDAALGRAGYAVMPESAVHQGIKEDAEGRPYCSSCHRYIDDASICLEPTRAATKESSDD